MYNMIFGENKNALLLLGVLGLIREDFYRYRDCYLSEEGEIAVYTRGGGNNRNCYCEDYGHEPHDDDSCVVPSHEKNREHAMYLRDEDDSFDNTYATFYFSIPEDVDREKLVVVEPELARDEIWVSFLSALRDHT